MIEKARGKRGICYVIVVVVFVVACGCLWLRRGQDGEKNINITDAIIIVVIIMIIIFNCTCNFICMCWILGTSRQFFLMEIIACSRLSWGYPPSRALPSFCDVLTQRLLMNTATPTRPLLLKHRSGQSSRN